MSAPTLPRDLRTPDRLQQEREAVERLLATGIFERSPNLAVFLRYVCSRYFEGRQDELREYNIAVEALGRPANFDQKRDAIVRVEAHRLRKRLQQYYAGKGAEEPVRVDIPAGSYAPQFHFREPAVPSEVAAIEEAAVVEEPPTVEIPPIVPAPAAPPEPRSRWPYVLLALALVLAVGAYLLRGRQAAPSDASDQPVPAAADLSEVRIMAGSTAARYVGRDGNVWAGDRYFTGGTAESVPPRPIQRTLDSALYLTRRQGHFKYDIPLKAGNYELRLHFAETIFGENNVAGGGESSRIFSVRANDERLLHFWDALADAGGPNVANIKVFPNVKPGTDGVLHLEFRPTLKEEPFVNAIEIVPGLRDRMRPVRILARAAAYTDKQGQEWSADHYYTGGQLVQRTDEVSGARDQALYQSERYGHFSYVIPVVAGSKYTATLHFTEHWFGPGRPGGGGEGSRVFDVYMNGRVLLENFDVFQQAGGALKTLERTFRNLHPNAQGKLVFQFVPVRNYALFNAISVVDEGR